MLVEPCEPDPGLLDIEAIGLPIQEEVDVYHLPGRCHRHLTSIFPDCEEDAEAEENRRKRRAAFATAARSTERPTSQGSMPEASGSSAKPRM